MAGSYEGTRAPRRWGRTALWVLGIVVVLGVTVGGTAAAGGFRAVPPKPVPVAPVGAPVRNGELEITTVSARYRRTDPLDDFASRGRYVEVLFHVTNVAQQTAFAGEVMSSPNITLTGRPAGTRIGTDEFDIAVGKVQHADLQPSMPQPVRLVAKVPAGAPVPRELELAIYRMKYAPGFLDQEKSWSRTTDIAARVTVPVRGGR